VLAVCIGVLGSQHDAEDAAQEVFTALAVALRGERPRELRPWLVRVARNAAIDAARRRRRGAAGTELSDWRAIADGGIKDELDSVLAAIRELPESQRTALLLRELAGHSYQEIAVLLGTDEEAVRGLIARARIGLRNHREAAELPCAAARHALAAEPDGRRLNAVVRRHVRHCPSCQAYRTALRADAKALHALAPVSVGGMAGGAGALVGAAAKGVLAGGALTQAGAACAVSICSVGGIVLLAPHLVPHSVEQGPGAAAHHRLAAERPAAATRRHGSSPVVATSSGLTATVAYPGAADGPAAGGHDGHAGWGGRSSSAGRGSGTRTDSRDLDGSLSPAGLGRDGQRSAGGPTGGGRSGDSGAGGRDGGGAGSGGGRDGGGGGAGPRSGAGGGTGYMSRTGGSGDSSGSVTGGDGASHGGSAGGSSTATSEWVNGGDSSAAGVGGAGGAGGSGQSAPAADRQPATGSADGSAAGSTVSDAGSGGSTTSSSGG
jgi:RNA polymerase sigma factor (sigma-70 family)